MNRSKKILILLSLAFITVRCSYKCHTPICENHIMINGFSGNNFLMHYSYFSDLDSLWVYEYGNYNHKIIGYDVILVLEGTKNIHIKCNSNKISDELKVNISKYHNRINKIIFKNFIIVNLEGNKVNFKGNGRVSFKYFSIESYEDDRFNWSVSPTERRIKK